MQVVLKPGEKVTASFAGTDGEIEVEFAENAIRAFTSWPDTKGRSGVIYEECFGEEHTVPVDEPMTGSAPKPEGRDPETGFTDWCQKAKGAALLDGQPAPLLSELLYQVCSGDLGKFDQAVELLRGAYEAGQENGVDARPPTMDAN